MQDDPNLDSDLGNITIKKAIEKNFVIKPHFKVLIFIILFSITATFLDFPDPPVTKQQWLSEELY